MPHFWNHTIGTRIRVKRDKWNADRWERGTIISRGKGRFGRQYGIVFDKFKVDRTWYVPWAFNFRNAPPGHSARMYCKDVTPIRTKEVPDRFGIEKRTFNRRKPNV